MSVITEDQVVAKSENLTQKELKKRAIRIIKTKELIMQLADLQSSLENQYWSSYHCSRELKQEGNYIASEYCNKRWCFECNAIRSAKMINGYKPVLQQFWNKQFVTLTRPNVDEFHLKDEIKSLVKDFTLTIRHLRERKKIDIKGIRKIEVTYNRPRNNYHPHFHLIVDSLPSARAIVQEWLFRNPNASPDAQKIQKADETSFVELFKYATKEIANPKIRISALNVIFLSLIKIRTYQPFGIKKYISEDVDSLVRQAYGMLNPTEHKVWRFDDNKKDWISLWNESLIDSNGYENST